VKTPPVRGFFLFLLVAAAALAAASPAAASRVLAVEFHNDVNPVTKDFVNGQIDRANDEGYDAVVILLDTPGGLSTSMEDIYKKELASKVAVIVYVSPQGASASSAGVWIAQAGDILAMAPQTTIGSSTPISGSGENLPKDLRKKAINQAAKSLRSIAEAHGRNGDWAEQAVRQASNLTDTEALEMNVIDLRAPDLPTLLDRVDGRTTKPKGIVLNTADAQITEIKMGLWKSILDLLIDPNIVYIMLTIGLIGIIVELWNPGLIFPGTVGAISLIISLYAAQVLPVSWAGLLLMLLAGAFIGAEPFVVSHGALTVAGAVCFVLGGLLLFEPSGGMYEVSLPVLIGVSTTLAAMMAFIVVKIVQVRKRPVAVGVNSVVGAQGVVRGPGMVFVNGELWRARTENGEALRSGDHVTVEGVDGLELRVRPST
jgi:membrane-bound serine protease (ClpP class)